MSNLAVSIIGAGFVGLTTAVVFAHKGIKTICVEIDKDRLNILKGRKAPFYEPDLDSMLKDCIDNNTISFTDDIDYAINNSNITFICVGTPQRDDGSIDLKYVRSAAISIGKALIDKSGYHLIVIKSTVTPGTNHMVKKVIEEYSNKRFGKDFGIISNPEFLREGSAIYDTLNPNFLLIGADNDRDAEILEELYTLLYKPNIPKIIKVNTYTAELVKYAINSFLATKISFINTIANICQRLPSVDVNTVASIIGLDPRIGPLFLKAGPGYGGSCLPKDVNALINFSKALGYDPILFKTVQEVNRLQKDAVLGLVNKLIENIEGKTIAVLGLAFKKDSDDIRESVSIKIIKDLLDKGCRVKVHDPMAIENAKKVFKDSIIYCKDKYECISDSDCCIILTEWDEYKELEPEHFKSMKSPIVIDARRVLDHEKFIDKVRFAAVGLGYKELLDYKIPSVSVNAIIEDKGKVLLVKRRKEPFKGYWSLPGGYVEYGESVEEALRREVKEEVGIDIEIDRLLNVYSDPFRHIAKHTIAIVYKASIVNGKISNNEEISDAKFFSKEEIPEILAFDHKKMIEDYLKV